MPSSVPVITIAEKSSDKGQKQNQSETYQSEHGHLQPTLIVNGEVIPCSLIHVPNGEVSCHLPWPLTGLTKDVVLPPHSGSRPFLSFCWCYCHDESTSRLQSLVPENLQNKKDFIK